MNDPRSVRLCMALVFVVLACSPKQTPPEAATVTLSGTHVSVQPPGPVTVTRGQTTSFAVTAETDFLLSTTVSGDCPAGQWQGSTYTTGAIHSDCSLGFSATARPAVTHQVTANGDGQETIAPSETQTVAHGATQAFTVVAAQGFLLSHTPGGTCPAGSWSENVYTTGAVNADCSVTFAATAITHTVTASGDGHETISPSDIQTVTEGATQAFTVTPDSGFSVSTTVGGTCPTGSWNASTYSSGPITTDCTVIFSATAITHTVTPMGDLWETIDPGTPQIVAHGETQSFAVAASTGYTLSAAVGGSCPSGSWDENVYTTGAISSDCTVIFSATLSTYSVSAAGDSRETIAPSAVQTVPYGGSQSFTVTASTGYTVATTVGGNCPAGSWNGNVYTTGAIASDCSVSFSATLNSYAVSASGDSFESIAPNAPQTVTYGSAQSFTVTANTGYTVGTTVGGDCPSGSWNGNVYTTGAIASDCSVGFSATLNTYQVSVSGDSHETIDPSSVRTINHGSTQSYAVTPDSDYLLSTVSGSCPAGSWEGSVYRTGPITRDCTVAFSAVPTPSSATTVSIVSGDNQSGAVGAQVASPLTVLVVNADGVPVPNVTIAWSTDSAWAGVSVDPSGWSPSTQTVTDAQGQTSIHALLGIAPGTDAFIAALDSDPSASVTFHATAPLAKVSGEGQIGVVASELGSRLIVLVTNAEGIPLPGATVDWSTESEGGSVSTDESTWASTVQSITNVSGETFIFAALGTTAGAQRFRATLHGNESVTLTFTATATPDVASSLSIFSGDAQSARVGTVLALPLTALVTDAYGNPLPGVTVDWPMDGDNTVSSDGVSFTRFAQTITGEDGQTFVWGMLPTYVSTFHFYALLDSDDSIWTQFVATSLPGDALGLFRWSGNEQTAAVGSQLPATAQVVVLDAYMNGVPGVTVTWAVTSGGGRISTDGASWTSSARAVADADGFASIFMQLGPTVGPATFEASLDDIPESTVTFSEHAFDPTAVTLTIDSGDNQSAIAEGTLYSPLSVQLVDSDNNPLPHVIVHWSVTSGGGSVEGQQSRQSSTDSDGFARVQASVGPTPGSNSYMASIEGVPTVSVTFHATGTATPTSLEVVSGDGQSGTVGQPLAAPLTVALTDASSKPIAGLVIHWRGDGKVSSDDTTWSDDATSITDANGQASIAAKLGIRTGQQTFTAAVEGSNLSVAFKENAGAGRVESVMAFAGVQRHLVGTALAYPLQALALDEYGNTVPGATLEFSVFDGDGAVSSDGAAWSESAQVVTNAQGQASVRARLGPVAGEWRYLVMSADNPAARGDFFYAIATATVGPPARVVVVSGDDQTGNAGTELLRPLVAAVTDEDLNPVYSSRVLITVNYGGGLVSLDNADFRSAVSTPTDANGYVSFWGHLGTPGMNWFKAILFPRFDISADFVFQAETSSAATISLGGGENQTGAAGDVLGTPLSVLVVDAQDRPVVGATVNWAVDSGGGSLSADQSSWSGSAQSVSNFRGYASIYAATGATPGPNSFTATLGDSTVRFSATGALGAARVVNAVAGDHQTFAPGTALGTPLTVRTTDAHGNVIAGTAVDWSSTEPDVQFSADGSSWSGTLQTTSDTSGQTSVFAVAGASLATQMFKASLSSGAGSWTFEATLVSRHVAVSGDGFETIDPTGDQDVPYGSAPSFTVTNIPGYVVSLSVGGTCPAGSWSGLVYTAGAIHADCSIEFSASQQTFGAAATLSFTQQPTDAVAGDNLATVQIAIVDADGETILNDNSDTVTLSLSGGHAGATLGGTITQPVVRGIATFPDLSLTRAGTGYVLVASTSGLIDGLSDAFAIAPAVVTGIAFRDEPLDTVAGRTMTAVTVAVQDAYGNTVTTEQSAQIILTLASESASFAAGTLARTVVDGIATFDDLVLTRAGTGYSLSASMTDHPEWSGWSNPFAVTVAAAAELSFTASPLVAYQNEPFYLSVTLSDGYGNPIMDALDVSVSIASFGNNPGGTLSGTLTQPLQYGGAVFSDLRIDVASTGYTLQVSAGGLTQTTDAFTVSTVVCPFITEQTACIYSPYGCQWGDGICHWGN